MMIEEVRPEEAAVVPVLVSRVMAVAAVVEAAKGGGLMRVCVQCCGSWICSATRASAFRDIAR